MSNKRVLIISYYWPPSAGGGVQRWLKMSKYLPEYGWQPVVLTPENPDFELKDESLFKDVSTESEILKIPIWEPFGLYRKLMGEKAIQKQGVVDTKNTSFLGKVSRWIRGNWFIPDPRIFWVRPAVNYLTKYLAKHPVDVIITTGPPHSMHLIGMEVKRRLKVKWIADFRDPWSDWDVLPQLNLNKKSWATHRKLEHKVMYNADIVLTVTKNLATKLAATGGIAKVEVITNGFDKDDFEEIKSGSPSKFRIAHVGLLNDGRNPKMLWKVLNELCAENEDFNEHLEVVLAGTIEQSVNSSIQEFEQLQPKVFIPDYMAHSKVLKLYQQSAVLLLLVNNTSNSSWILPGKLFEYFSAKRPILAIGKLDSEANDVLQECGYDSFLTYEDKSDLKHRLNALFNQYKNDSVQIDHELINRYNRKKLAGELAILLNELDSK
jgi:glycosyltransferase involved in cell wall biosynthesis